MSGKVQPALKRMESLFLCISQKIKLLTERLMSKWNMDWICRHIVV